MKGDEGLGWIACCGWEGMRRGFTRPWGTGVSAQRRESKTHGAGPVEGGMRRWPVAGGAVGWSSPRAREIVGAAYYLEARSRITVQPVEYTRYQ